jgi:hypothetical protein
MSKKPPMMFVKPNPKWPLGVRDPISLGFLKPEGEWKPKNGYWLRRAHFEDVIECAPPAPMVSTVVETGKKGTSQ